MFRSPVNFHLLNCVTQVWQREKICCFVLCFVVSSKVFQGLPPSHCSTVDQ
uniref:Uncharacterized protein n=1 Tax=Anguilla anguilla TaxID=7936 RepID=A0A0E9PBH7_ANGAN